MDVWHDNRDRLPRARLGEGVLYGALGMLGFQALCIWLATVALR